MLMIDCSGMDSGISLRAAIMVQGLKLIVIMAARRSVPEQ